MLQVEFQAIQGNHTSGFVAFDDVQLAQTDECQFKPEAAWPQTETTTEPTTPVPTESPDSQH